MATGEGKGWAKGRSAKDDLRIAKAAAGHRGLTYEQHVPPELDRRRMSPSVDTTWTPTLAYAIGLMATDGCVADSDHVSFPSADLELVELFRQCLGKNNTISRFITRTGGVAYRVQFGDVKFCRWLATIGITGRKSLTIAALEVPDGLILPLTRGLLDGDGSIMNKTARADTGGRSDYHWEYLRTKFVSASRAHVEWLGDKLRPYAKESGYIEVTRARRGRHEMYALRYGKRASLRLLPLLYADPNAPRLTRKWRVWDDYRSRHRLPTN